MDLLADFITDDRVGYCEQFAAAMAAMGRTLGIPSRVVVGLPRTASRRPTAGSSTPATTGTRGRRCTSAASAGCASSRPPAQRAGATPAWTRQDINAADPSAPPSTTTAPSRAPDVPSSSDRRPRPAPTTARRSRGGRSPGSVLVVLVGVGPGVVRRAQRRRRLGAARPGAPRRGRLGRAARHRARPRAGLARAALAARAGAQRRGPGVRRRARARSRRWRVCWCRWSAAATAARPRAPVTDGRAGGALTHRRDRGVVAQGDARTASTASAAGGVGCGRCRCCAGRCCAGVADGLLERWLNGSAERAVSSPGCAGAPSAAPCAA